MLFIRKKKSKTPEMKTYQKLEFKSSLQEPIVIVPRKRNFFHEGGEGKSSERSSLYSASKAKT